MTRTCRGPSTRSGGAAGRPDGPVSEGGRGSTKAGAQPPSRRAPASQTARPAHGGACPRARGDSTCVPSSGLRANGVVCQNGDGRRHRADAPWGPPWQRATMAHERTRRRREQTDLVATLRQRPAHNAKARRCVSSSFDGVDVRVRRRRWSVRDSGETSRFRVADGLMTQAHGRSAAFDHLDRSGGRACRRAAATRTTSGADRRRGLVDPALDTRCRPPRRRRTGTGDRSPG